MSRKKPPYVSFFHQDFALGVRGMDRRLVGDYIRLLCALWDSDNGTLPLDVEPLHLALECRRSDVAARVKALVDKGKIYIGQDGLIHNLRTDRDRSTSAEVQPNLARSSAEVHAKLRPHNPKKRMKSKVGGAASRARAPLPLPKNPNLPLSSLDDLATKKPNGSASAMLGSPGLMDRSPSPPSERESTGPPNYSAEPVQPSPALLRSLERMKPKPRR